MNNDKPLATFEIKGYYFKASKKSKKNTKTFPCLNNMLSYAITSPYKYNDLKQKFEKLTMRAIAKDLNGFKADCRVKLKFIFVEPVDGHYRDYDNITAGSHKIILDALKKFGVIKDDAPQYVDMSEDIVMYTNDTPFIRVGIFKADEWQMKMYKE